MRALACLVVLAVAQWYARPTNTGRQDSVVSERFSGAVHAAFLGGLRPILVQYLWYDVERAIREGRELDVLRELALLQQVDPDNAKAIRYMASYMALTLASREQLPTARIARILDAIQILERAERRLPEDPTLPALRAQLISADRWSGQDAALYRSWTERRKKTPSAEAVEAGERAFAISGRPAVARLLADKLLFRGIEIALVDGDLELAHRMLARAVRIETPHQGAAPPLGVLLTRSWERLLRGLAKQSLHLAAKGVGDLVSTLRLLPPPGLDIPPTDDLLILAILGNCLDLGRSPRAASKPEDVLSLVVAVHNISAALEGRLSAVGAADSLSDVRKGLRDLAAGLLERAPGLADRLPPTLR